MCLPGENRLLKIHRTRLGKKPQKIGLISDTHALLRDEALHALRGSDLIIHAGDIGDSKILQALRQIAPVVAVRGNVDTSGWAKSLPETAVAEAGAINIYVLHDSNALDLDPKAAGFHIVVSGHSHKPGRSERDGVVYINPGSAGPRRFNLPITVARLDLGARPWSVEFVDLEKGRRVK
ncbi:MAG TPA: metallophosphoesterase family protein [Candidatus Acidoferrum sp.]|nr:metallophosphoesterase family protein [Candidatus Acidoferrum sp.]